MDKAGRDKSDKTVPKKRRVLDESVDQSAKCIEAETVEVETEAPAEQNEPVEESEQPDEPACPTFDEG